MHSLVKNLHIYTNLTHAQEHLSLIWNTIIIKNIYLVNNWLINVMYSTAQLNWAKPQTVAAWTKLWLLSGWAVKLTLEASHVCLSFSFTIFPILFSYLFILLIGVSPLSLLLSAIVVFSCLAWLWLLFVNVMAVMLVCFVLFFYFVYLQNTIKKYFGIFISSSVVELLLLFPAIYSTLFTDLFIVRD